MKKTALFPLMISAVLAGIMCRPATAPRPAIVILSPADGASLYQNEAVLLEIVSVSPTKIEAITLKINGQTIDGRIKETEQGASIIQQEWIPQTSGLHLLEVEAIDVNGNSSGLYKRTFTIQSANPSPDVKETAPPMPPVSNRATLSQTSGTVIYNFLAQADEAVWYNASQFPLNWNGLADNPQGMARLSENVILEDGLLYAQVLETHPEWRPEGEILGRFKLDFQLQPQDRFVTQLGFVQNATSTDGVTFYFCFVTFIEETCLAEINKSYNQQLIPVEVDLSSLNDYNAGWFELRVKANQNSNQDWAVWVYPRIER